MAPLLSIFLHHQVIPYGKELNVFFDFSVFIKIVVLYVLRYGFERKPYLSLSAKPKVFNREVTLSYVTDWIEKKLIELVEVCTVS